MAENKCECCICIACRFKDTDYCFRPNLCIDCNKEYTTMLCPDWKKKERGEDGMLEALLTGRAVIIYDQQ